MLTTENLLLMLAVLVTAVMGVMIYWIVQLNRLRALSADWDRQREKVFKHAAQIKVEAEKEKLKIKTEFGSYGPPYAPVLAEAVEIFEGIDQDCENIIRDRGRISADEIDYISFLSAVVFFPIFKEMKERHTWWQKTQQIQRDFAKIPPKQKKANHLARQLASQDQITKERCSQLLEAATTLKAEFKSESRGALLPFTNERNQMERIRTQLGRISYELLAGENISHQDVIEAHPKINEVQEQIYRLKELVESTKHERREAAEVMETVRGQILVLGTKLRTEALKESPIPELQAEFSGLKNEETQVEHELHTGNYKNAVEMGNQLLSKIEEKTKNLTKISTARQTLRTQYDSLNREAQTTHNWLTQIPTRYTLDATLQLLSEIRGQLNLANRTIRSNDLDTLQQANLPDPQILVAARQNFETNSQEYERHQARLSTQITGLGQKIEAVIPNLTGRNKRYLSGVNLGALESQNATLQNQWATIASNPIVKESELTRLIRTLHGLEKSHATLEQSYKVAQIAWTKIGTDLQTATEVIHSEAFRNSRDRLEYIASHASAAMAQTAAQYLDTAAGLQASLEQKERFYATLEREAKTLLTLMQKLSSEYQRELDHQNAQYQNLLGSLTKIQQNLQEFQQHQLDDLRLIVQEPLKNIATWKSMYTDIQKESLQALRDLYNQGLPIQTNAQFIYQDAAESYQEYQRIREKSENGLEEARTALDEAIQVLRNRPWIVQAGAHRSSEDSQNDDLSNARWFLRRASIDLAELDNPKRKYTCQIAIDDLEKKVYPTALKAKDEAKRTSKQIRDQITQIADLRLQLEQALGAGKRFARDITDPNLHTQWLNLERNYRSLENKVRTSGGFETARALLSTGLRETEALISRMENFSGYTPTQNI